MAVATCRRLTWPKREEIGQRTNWPRWTKRIIALGVDCRMCKTTHRVPVFPLRKFYTEQMFVLLRTRRKQLPNHADTEGVKRSQLERTMRYIYSVLKFRMSEVRENEIALRKLSGGNAQLRTLEEILPRTLNDRQLLVTWSHTPFFYSWRWWDHGGNKKTFTCLMVNHSFLSNAETAQI